MLIQSKIAISLAVVMATASAAVAAPRQAIRQQGAMAHATAVRHVPARAFLSFGSAAGSARLAKPTYMTIQDIGFKENLGD